MSLPFLALDFEEQLVRLKATLVYQSFKRNGADELGMPKWLYGINWWVASTVTPKKTQGEGATPREAVLKLYKSLE
jgi:hypothetical protein